MLETNSILQNMCMHWNCYDCNSFQFLKNQLIRLNIHLDFIKNKLVQKSNSKLHGALKLEPNVELQNVIDQATKSIWIWDKEHIIMMSSQQIPTYTYCHYEALKKIRKTRHRSKKQIEPSRSKEVCYRKTYRSSWPICAFNFIFIFLNPDKHE